MCKRFTDAHCTLKLIDTPGPDEDYQGKLLEEKVQQILMDVDAVICVVNGKQLRNQAQASIGNMISSK